MKERGLLRPLDPLGRQELINQSLHRFQGRNRAGVFANQFSLSPGERFRECVPFIGSKARLGDKSPGAVAVNRP